MTTDTISAAAAATSRQAVAYWSGSDGSGLDMDGMTASEALAELLGQCGTGEQQAAILAGRFALCDYNTAETIRPASAEEAIESAEAAEGDGGRGVIEIDGRRCYVELTD